MRPSFSAWIAATCLAAPPAALEPDIAQRKQNTTRELLPARQVHYVDVVAHTGPVWRLVVGPVHGEVRQLADRDLGHIRHQVVRHPVRVLADLAAGVRADR
eukprot:63617-Rhodomonas_salina.2